MSTEYIPYRKTGYFSSLICDYLDKKKELEPFYHRFPEWEHFKEQAAEKASSFGTEERHLLQQRLKAQYAGFKLTEQTLNNIQLLNRPNTFTVTTGHQLNLFTGPLYFLYKIFTVIKLCEALSEKYKQINVVPVFWMASEDHDFEEINFFKHQGQKCRWEVESASAVGRRSTHDIKGFAQEVESLFGSTERGSELARLFKRAYLAHDSLASATRFLVNHLFGSYGLLILDGDDPQLKERFSPVVRQELLKNRAYRYIEKSTLALEAAGYPKQVHPREINLFYLTDQGRYRIIREGNRFYLSETKCVFGHDEMLDIVRDHPERFSPNAVLRPLYQEMLLPNLCYVGGGAELAYWFQLKECFKQFSVPFPILLLRNSVLIMSGKEKEKLSRMDRSVSDIFLPKVVLENIHTKEMSDIPIDFDPQRSYLKQQFSDLYRMAEQTDASFLRAVAAQEKKQLNGLDKLEQRLLKAQKRKLASQLERLTGIQGDLFPDGSLQERSDNFSDFYMEYGPKFFDDLYQQLRPLDLRFTVLCW